MAIPNTIIDFVTQKGVEFSVLAHQPTETSLESAHAAHVSAKRVAKGVLLRTDTGYLLAVLPASHELMLDRVEHYTNLPVSLAAEESLGNIFTDCSPGAVPALAPAYGLRSIVDLTLAYATEVYFEAGDHKELLHVAGEDYRKLILENAQFAEISRYKSS